ncbi:hypothetical protein HNV12_02790 [Methanococcoides sp. SA1]|nr:hypothetical protein [Methanococcoides sp. SA1]
MKKRKSAIEGPSLKSLIDEVIPVIDTGNARYIVLTLQLYVEHYVNEIISELIKKPAKNIVISNLTFPKKLNILKKMKILNSRTKEILLKLNEVRNLLIHNLIINTKEIKNNISGQNFEFVYNWFIESNKGKKREEGGINLKSVYQKIPDKFVQLEVSTIIIIGILHDRLWNTRGEPNNQFIKVSFEKENDNWQVRFNVFEKVKFNEK